MFHKISKFTLRIVMYPKTIPHWQILIIIQKRYYFVNSPGDNVNYKAEVVIGDDGENVEIREDPDTFAVSTYVPLSESDISARGPRLSAPTPGDEAQIDRNGRSILWIVVLVLIALLIIEWGVYYRDEY